MIGGQEASPRLAGRPRGGEERPERTVFDERVVAAGLLHDTVEDSAVEIEDLAERFGRSVAKLVSAMTEPECPRGFRERKAAHRRQIAGAGSGAAAIFAADKVVQVHNLRRAIARRGEDSVRRGLSKPLGQKIEHCHNTLEMLDGLAFGLPLIPLLREELESLEALRARGAQGRELVDRPAADG